MAPGIGPQGCKLGVVSLERLQVNVGSDGYHSSMRIGAVSTEELVVAESP